MSCFTRTGLTLALVLCALGSASLVARGEEKRQYYGPWSFYEARGYYYRILYYQPTAGSAYKYHYSIFFQNQPGFVYFFDPESGKYWGRLDVGAEGEERFSLLRGEDQKPMIRDIPETAFPKPGKMPAIPGAKDGVAIAPFPKDLPKP